MGVQRRHFLLLVTLAAAAATPASGQAVPPAVGPASSGTQGAASIPDFSGRWTHPYCCEFETPQSGPGPVVNKMRRRQLRDADGRPLPATSAPLVSDNNKTVGDYTNPILKSEAAEVVKKHGEISLAGIGYPTPTNQCWPEPVPYIFWNFAIQILQRADKITILYLSDSSDHQVRHVRMNEAHPALVTPSWYGDSVGHYEGDTLVIDTVGIKTDRPFAMIDAYGTPYTEALHVVERYRLLDYEAARERLERVAKEYLRVGPGQIPAADDSDPNYRGKHLQLHFTVEDEGVFTTPWAAMMTYGRPIADAPEQEHVCAENMQWYSGKNAAVPRADKPDF